MSDEIFSYIFIFSFINKWISSCENVSTRLVLLLNLFKKMRIILKSKKKMTIKKGETMAKKKKKKGKKKNKKNKKKKK